MTELTKQQVGRFKLGWELKNTPPVMTKRIFRSSFMSEL
jgi:hypothetical protein